MALKVKLVLSITILLMVLPCFGEVAAVLPDLLKPQKIYVDSDRFYVVENLSIFIYSLSDFKLIKKFGKKGEGPREFKRFSVITITPDKLFINSGGKVSYYSKEGEFLSEKRATGVYWIFKPVENGKRFVGYGTASEDNVRYRTVNLFDGNLKKVKELTRNRTPIQQSGRIDPIATMRGRNYFTSADRVYVESFEDGIIKCFDTNGQLIHSINPGIEQIKVTKEDEAEMRAALASHPSYKEAYEALKSRVFFPEYYPRIKTYQLVDNKLYVITYKKLEKSRHYECLVLDAAGKLLNRGEVHIQVSTAVEEFPYTIKNGKFYQLVENEDDEEIELHITSI
jgi:hypothetical protein